MNPPLPVPPRVALRSGWRHAEYASLDFETTGLDFDRDVIVSFGVVPIRAGRAIVAESVHQLVKPVVPPSPRSQKIHELRPQDLAGAPGIEEAREALRSVLEGRVLLVWFADVEIAFLSAIFGCSSRVWRRRMIDVRDLAIAVDGRPPSTREQPGYALGAEARRQ